MSEKQAFKVPEITTYRRDELIVETVFTTLNSHIT